MKNLEELFWNAVALCVHLEADITVALKKLTHSRKHKDEYEVLLEKLYQQRQWARELCEYLDEKRRDMPPG
jgi:hypothetical protein